MKLKKGDRVQVLSGKDRGKQGNIMKVIPKKNRAIVDGVNIAKHHQKPTKTTTQGGIIDRDMPINASNLAIVCPSCGPTRVGYRFEETATSQNKIRICRKCGGDL